MLPALRFGKLPGNPGGALLGFPRAFLELSRGPPKGPDKALGGIQETLKRPQEGTNKAPRRPHPRSSRQYVSEGFLGASGRGPLGVLSSLFGTLPKLSEGPEEALGGPPNKPRRASREGWWSRKRNKLSSPEGLPRWREQLVHSSAQVFLWQR